MMVQELIELKQELMKLKLKKIALVFTLLASLNGYSQSPEGINYQATVRDNGGNLLTNQSVTVIFTLRQTSAIGTTVYRETHSVNTNSYGGFNAIIGGGTSNSGTFSTIDWSAGPYYLNVNINGNDLGTTQLISVPYALYAKNSGSSTPGPQGPAGPAGPEASDDQDIDSITLKGKTLTVYITNGNSASVILDSITGLFEIHNGTIRQKEGNYTTNFLFGSPQIDNMGDSADNTRMIFSKETGAFRAGSSNYDNSIGTRTSSDYWNKDSLGIFSFASGLGTRASGEYSVAMGRMTNASGPVSIAFGAETEASNVFSMAYGAATKASGYLSTASGWYSEASGYGSIAMGYETKAKNSLSVAMGQQTQANGNSSLVVGVLNDTLISNDNSISDSTPLFIVGNGDFNSWPVTRSNAFTVFYNGEVNINDEYSLPLNDGDSGQIITTNGNGNLAWEDNQKLFENNKGTIRQKEGYDTTNFLFGSPQMDDDGNNNHYSRMFFNKDKGAFRAGYVFNDNWDVDSLGIRSFASGYNTKAVGNNSTAMGYRTNAIGIESTAIGNQTKATGNSSMAMGFLSEATGHISTAMGGGSDAIGDYSTAMGLSTNATGDYSTSMGGYTFANLDYSTALGRYNDTIGINSLLFSIGNGTSNGNRLNSMHIYGGSNNAYFRGNIYPMVNNTVNLGRSFNRWNTIYATNGTINTSDTTLKSNITPLSYGLDDLMKVKTISYTWKDDARQIKKIGFNAQNLLEIIPEVVQTHSVQTDENTGDTAYLKNETLGVFYSDMIPVLTKSIQEQQVIIEQEKAKNAAANNDIEVQKAKTQALQVEVDKLKSDLETLKQMILNLNKR